MILRFRHSLSALLQRFAVQNPPSGGQAETREEVIKGTVDRVIVVQDPVPGVFREAVFFLEDAPSGGVDRETLMRQARKAASDYISAHSPARPYRPSRARWLIPPVCVLLTAAAMKLLGL